MKNEDTIEQSLFDRQVALEAEMVSRGTNLFKKKVSDAKVGGKESTTAYGSFLTKKAIAPVAAAIRVFTGETKTGKAGRKNVAAGYLRDIDAEVIAFISLRCCLNFVSTQVTFQNAAITVASQLENEARLTYFEKANIDEYRKATKATENTRHERHKQAVFRYIASKNDIDLPTWPKRDKLLIGQKLIEIVIDTTGFIEITADYKAQKGKPKEGMAYIYNIVGSKKCLDWISRMNDFSELAAPEFMPTIIPPCPWTRPYGGGYYSLYKPMVLVKGGSNNYLEELDLAADSMPEVYRAINAMQDTGYTINKPVLDVMRQLWEAGGDVAGIPSRDNYTLPRCPVCGAEIPSRIGNKDRRHSCFEDINALSGWKRDAALVYEKNISTLSKRVQFARTLNIADRFKDEKAVYFPMQLDFRGRCYAVPSFLNPQGADPAKGLLMFEKGKPLSDNEDAVKWLAIHGANTWGNDKVSLDDRYAWVLEQEANILAIAENPHDNRMWFDADKPWQFLAFCFEWAEFKKVGPSFVSRLPVAMDGTCNGLQIFSLMLRDPIGGMATNLLPTDKPQDIYQIVADKTIEKLREKTATGVEVYRKDDTKLWYDEKDFAYRLLGFGINRKSTKRQVMVLPYGGTFRSCCEYTLEHITERLNDSAVDDVYGISHQNAFAVSHFLAGLIWEAIGETVVAARVAMGFLQKLASLAAAEGLPVNWNTPIGFLVSQAYINMKEYRVKTRLGASIIRLTVKEEGEERKIDKRRQRNGISPNFVHSLDAAAMFRSICLAMDAGVSSFMMIHDSYGVPASDAASMAHCLRTAFVRMFTEEDVLASLRDSIAAMLPEESLAKLPELPEKGDLDITKVLYSAYFFA